MITVSILTGSHDPVEEGIAFELVSGGRVVASAKTDAAGVVSFDVDSSAFGEVAIRLQPESTEQH